MIGLLYLWMIEMVAGKLSWTLNWNHPLLVHDYHCCIFCFACSVDISNHGEKEDIYRLGLVLLEVITGKHSGSDSDVDPLRSQVEACFFWFMPAELTIIGRSVCWSPKLRLWRLTSDDPFVVIHSLQLHVSLLDSPADLKGLADPTIRGTFAADSLRTAAEIALKCLSVDPSQRPSIDDVLWNLRYSAQIQDGGAMGENSSVQV